MVDSVEVIHAQQNSNKFGSVFAQDKLQNGELQLFMKGVERSILFPDQDIYLRKIENNYSRGANNGSSSRSSNDSSNGLNNGNSRGSGSGGGRR